MRAYWLATHSGATWQIDISRSIQSNKIKWRNGQITQRTIISRCSCQDKSRLLRSCITQYLLHKRTHNLFSNLKYKHFTTFVVRHRRNYTYKTDTGTWIHTFRSLLCLKHTRPKGNPCPGVYHPLDTNTNSHEHCTSNEKDYLLHRYYSTYWKKIWEQNSF